MNMESVEERRRRVEEKRRRIVEGTYPCFSNYQGLAERINSFLKYDWSPQTQQTPKQFAKAGFFYTGYGDGTICFQCGCSLKRWLKDDDPFVEHAKYSPQCHFLKVIKGEDFIRDVQKTMKRTPCINALMNVVKKTPKPPSSQQPKEEEEKIRLESIECLLCLNEEREIAFLPCQHLAACMKCSSKIKTCCICRTVIKSRMRIIIS